MSKLTIYKKVNLTEDTNNIEPKYVKKLFMGNEPDNELVQYYIMTDTSAQEDKKSNILLSNYDKLVWSDKRKRLTARKIRDLGIKTFPTYGAIGFFTYQYTPRSLILCPINKHNRKFESPILEMIINTDTLTFNIGTPSNITYECYRIILRCNEFAYEYITYDLSVTVPKPEVKGTYDIYCIGYENEGEAVSDDSNFLTLSVTEGFDTFAPKPEMCYYTKEQVDAMFNSLLDKYLKSAAFTNEGTKLQFTMSDNSTFYAEGSPGGGTQTPVTILAAITATPDSSDAHKCIGSINVTANSDIILCVISRSDITVPEGYELLYAIDPIISPELTTAIQRLYIYKKHCIDTGKQDITIIQTGTNSSFGFFACNIVGANNYFVGDIINANEITEDVSEVTLVKSSTNALVISHNQWSHENTVISKYSPDTDCLIYNAGPRCHLIADKSNTTVHTLALGQSYGGTSIMYKMWQTVVLNIS